MSTVSSDTSPIGIEWIREQLQHPHTLQKFATLYSGCISSLAQAFPECTDLMALQTQDIHASNLIAQFHAAMSAPLANPPINVDPCTLYDLCIQQHNAFFDLAKSVPGLTILNLSEKVKDAGFTAECAESLWMYIRGLCAQARIYFLLPSSVLDNLNDIIQRNQSRLPATLDVNTITTSMQPILDDLMTSLDMQALAQAQMNFDYILQVLRITEVQDYKKVVKAIPLLSCIVERISGIAQQFGVDVSEDALDSLLSNPDMISGMLSGIPGMENIQNMTVPTSMQDVQNIMQQLNMPPSQK